jgi:hypothetical protein
LAILHHAIATPPVIDPLILLPRLRDGLSPKPSERFVFVVLAFAVPIAACCSAIMFPQEGNGELSKFRRAVNQLLPVILAVLFFTPFIGFDFSQALLSGRSMPPEHPLRFLAAALAAAAIWYTWIALQARPRHSKNSFVSRFAWIVFLVLMLLQMFAWRVVGERSITVHAIWWNSADAVVYTVSQVFSGKTTLVDMPSQYGLFAEIVAPIFKISGISVLKFTALCALLQVASMSAVFYVLHKLIREPVLKIAVGIALVMVTFETSLWLINFNDRYFQYWPIRFFGLQFPLQHFTRIRTRTRSVEPHSYRPLVPLEPCGTLTPV